MLIQSHGTGPYEIDLCRLGLVYIVRVKKDGKELYKHTHREQEYAEKVWKNEVERCQAAHENK